MRLLSSFSPRFAILYLPLIFGCHLDAGDYSQSHMLLVNKKDYQSNVRFAHE